MKQCHLSQHVVWNKIFQNAKLVTTPDGGHHHMIDNAPVYFKHLADYLRQVEDGTFNK